MITGQKDKTPVLVVDDQQSVRDTVSRRLAREGYECTVAADGDIALKKLKADQFDLVLLDISMPRKSGADVLKEIRVKYPDTAVVMVTAIADAKTAINLMKDGAYDYVIKPIDFDILLVSIDKALDKRRLILENKAYQFSLEKKVREQTKKIRQTFINSITSLVYALEAKDVYTKGHSERVTKIAINIAKELKTTEDGTEKIRIAGLLHDIGKIGMLESVLNNSGNLTSEDFEHVKCHCEIGQRILLPIIEEEEILDIVLHHHERHDGTGYPHGLVGEQISPGAKIMAVADAYDAMTSDRPYRPAMSHKAACAELSRGKGTQFDPVVVEAFLQTVTERAKL